ncbi:hypothetical protein [Frondihabitans australicus]|uniref:Uncharacterized protein n=1 Tax=Frondihabitans australicus TaxID=386892 RepID=A0A495IG35_9MICO|nr:hypothetical protein [Frondihabitans australicus]RKR74967.1 hypothetical protein C8E83_2101 [Frondihabitans australicus]
MTAGAADTVTLWRPTGPEELDLVRESGWTAWPPRLLDQIPAERLDDLNAAIVGPIEVVRTFRPGPDGAPVET